MTLLIFSLILNKNRINQPKLFLLNKNFSLELIDYVLPIFDFNNKEPSTSTKKFLTIKC